VPPSDPHGTDADPRKQHTKGQLVVGHFHASFRDEKAAYAAARDARAVGFVADVRESNVGRWAVLARRKEPFPADEEHRYAARLQAIVSRHGGSYKRFVPESAR